MPNTLAHLGVQTLLSRAAIRRSDIRWIFLGYLIPDLPWIVGRATSTLLPTLHDNDFWAYYIAQSSLAVSLLLCGALAVLALQPSRAFGILAFNTTIHLLLDGLQTRWGNGVHLFAPMSWDLWNAGWFGLDSWPAWILTMVGAVVAPLAVWRAWNEETRLDLTRSRAIWATALLMLYLATPALLRQGPMTTASHALATLSTSSRDGRRIELDRTSYRVRGQEQFIETYGGDVIRVENRPLDHNASISIRATFTNDTTLAVNEFIDHSGSPRNTLNYFGLALVAGALLPPIRYRRRVHGETHE